MSLIEPGSFNEYWSNLYTYNFRDFLGYEKKLIESREKSGEIEAVITGSAIIGNTKCMLIVFEPLFMLGTMGIAAGEKIARAFYRAARKKLPVISVTTSGGVRMQEGIAALMQMAKTAAAVYKHKEKKLLYISIISDPTLGGVTASFVSLADIIIGEKGARFGFSGRKIIENTTHEILPDDFQTVEYAKQYGMVDIVAEKEEVKEVLTKLLHLHVRKGA